VLNKLLDIEFYKRTGHAVLACVTLLYLTVAYIFGVDVNMSIFADLTIIAGSLVLLPRIKLSGVESSSRLDRNIFGYFFLGIIVFVAIGDSHGFLSLPKDSKVEFFSIIAQICMVLFGVSKFEVSRNAIESVKDALNWRRGYASMMSSYYEDVSNGVEVDEPEAEKAQVKLEKETAEMAEGVPQGNLLAAMQKYRGMCEIKGAGHNKKLIKLAKMAGFDWYNKDEIPWCAVMMNICCMIAGVRGTQSAMAKSFLRWGREVSLEEARKNIGRVIAVFHRGESSKDPSGHVTAVEAIAPDGKSIIGIGGNQGDCVKSSKMRIDTWRFISFRMI